jgi:hypothetical protein
VLAVNRYPQEHVDACRAAMRRQLAGYDALAKVAGSAKGAALDAFEPDFFANLVLALDAWFLHRTRGTEGKNGNALNEVRVLSASIVDNGGVMTEDKTIKLKPETSVLGYALGDPIAIGRADFGRLLDAFLAEIESRFV